MRGINRIIVHCSYTPPSMDIDSETIKGWHVNENGWSDIGYHYVITRQGKIERGRPIERAGAHVRGHNEDSIGICLVGGMAEDKTAADSNFTRWQWLALASLIDSLEEEHGRLECYGHRDFDSGKECPCFDMQVWRAEP